MSVHLHAHRRDKNEQVIVDALRSLGVDIWHISAPGLPDLLSYSRGIWLPIEVKQVGQPLRPLQLETYRRAPFPIIHSVAEGLALFGVK